MDLSAKKQMAAKILGVGVSRVRIDPNEAERVADAITNDQIRQLIKDGVIWVEPAKGISKARHRARRAKQKRRGRGPGSKEGAAGARRGKKEQWVTKVRALRWRLKVMRDRGEIDQRVYRELYRQVKGGAVRSVAHLRELARQAMAVER